MRRTRLSAVLFLLALPCGTASPSSSSHSGEVRLYFDGREYDAREPAVALDPGEPSRVALEVEPRYLKGRHLAARLTRVLPDGEEIEERRQVDSRDPRAVFDLGPLAMPPVYEFEAGMVFQKGYSLRIRLSDDRGRVLSGWDFHQGMARGAPVERMGMGEAEPPVRAVRFLPGSAARVRFDPKFGAAAPLSLRLAPGVLEDQDDLRIEHRRNSDRGPERAAVRVAAADGKELLRREVTAGRSWQGIPVDCRKWAPGDYRVELRPIVGGKEWPDGPTVTYRRRPVAAAAILVSPLAPWKLESDPARATITVKNFREAYEKWGEEPKPPAAWKWSEGPSGAVSLMSQGDYTDAPIAYRFPGKGFYAVFVGVQESGALIQVGRSGLIRSVRPSPFASESFVAAADLSDDLVRFHPGANPRRWLDGKVQGRIVSLRLVPVTRRSVADFYVELGNPPVPLLAVDDWAEYFGPTWSRLLPDQFDAIVGGQAELGFRTLGWSVARSWFEYHSELPNSRRFPCIPYDEAKKQFDYSQYDYGRRIVMMNDFDPLTEVYRGRERTKAEIWPWLPMQRHYGAQAYGGIFACPFYREHPQWWRIRKDGSDSLGVSFFFPEVRRERLNILLEVARKGADGLIVGCDRQVPMLLYNPEMVKAYVKETGIDPRKIDASDGTAYRAWIRWRADFFTRLLRDLRRELKPLREQAGKPIPVAVRIPSAGLFLNLAQGLDVEQWLREGLVDQLQLDPLEDLEGRAEHDVRPYLDLARRHGVAVIGGIGSTAFLAGGGENPGNLVAGLERALGLLRAGVDGIDAYETEMLALVDPVRFVPPLYGNPRRLEEFLRNSNLDACFPVDASNAAAGHDNHSRWTEGWDVHGFGPRSL